MLCGSLCKVFNSQNREEYHRLRFKEHYSYEKLREHSKLLGEYISAMSFHRHFTKHVSPLETYRGSKEEDEWLEKKARERLDVIKEIEELLMLCKRKLEEVLRLPVKAANINALARIVSEVRQTLSYIAEHRASYLASDKLSEEESVSRFIEALEEVPPEFRERILARLRAVSENAS